MVRGNEASAGPAHDRNIEFFERFDDVLAKARRVGEGRARLEDSAVDLTVKMLDELPENHSVVRNRRRGIGDR